MIAAAVPVKPLDRAKGRLAAALPPEGRRGLVTAMLEDLVESLRAAPEVGAVLVVSPDETLLEAAKALGAEALPEPPGSGGINEALALAAARSAELGAEAMLVLPVDVPAVTPADVAALAAALGPAPAAVLCPAADGGTTALLVAPPNGMPLRFGPDSARRHLQAFDEAGVRWAVLELPSLARDLDTPDDVAHFLSLTGAPRTRAALRAAGLCPQPG